MIQWARTNNSSLTDFNQGSVIRSIYNAVAAILAQLYYGLHTIHRSARIIYSTGNDLDIAVAPRSITRRGATVASGVATFTGVPTTIIPLGMKIATEDGVEFVTMESEDIPAIGHIDIDIEAVMAGSSGMVSAKAINKLVDDVDGLVSVSNAAHTTGGYNSETDEQLRTRAITQLATLSKGIQTSYEAWAQGSRPDVLRAKAQWGHPGYSDKTVVIHVVKSNAGIFNTADLQEIAHYILSKAPLGLLVTCLNVDWAGINLTAQVRRATGYNLNTVQANIMANIDLYLDYREWEWGVDIDWSDLFSLVNNTLGVEEVSLSGFLPSSNVIMGEFQIPKYSSLTVTDW